ncbi:MAG TPA: alpha-L-fucosidase, partial [Chthonomonadaceae bacterium]|nr:alpha-L-fucosidase [Chthonomonadaceae bacterium]
PDQAYIDKWFHRVQDLVDSYHPDLLYFDDAELPLGQAGLDIAAHYYNADRQWHNGSLEAVLTAKDMPPDLRGTLVYDIERGRSDRLEAYPWQTDTCIGDWHYRRSLYTNHQYKTADQVIKMLADIVSKNGNLLLNIPVRGDGSIDDDEIHFLEEMARWMGVNSEAIFGTRPWIVYGEGPSRIRGGSFNEGGGRPFTAQDIRFTTKGGALYAILLGWPADGKVVLRSLARLPGTTGRVTGARLLGSPGAVSWVHDENGLTVVLPAAKPCDHAYVLKLTGSRLRDFKPEISAANAAPVVIPDNAGDLFLSADLADLHGAQVQVEQRGAQPNIGYWDNPDDRVSWTLQLPAPTSYTLTVQCAAADGPTQFVVEVDGQTLSATVPQTRSWDDYVSIPLGTITIQSPGKHTLTVRPKEPATWKPMNLLNLRMQLK